MLLTAYCRLAALEIERRSPLTRVMGATLVNDVNHAVLCMFLAVRPRLAALGVEFWVLHAGVM